MRAAPSVRGMTWIENSMVEQAGQFLWSTGRVLEQRRFAHLFEPGAGDESVAGVLAALDAYRSADGGYAFGLEPDVRGPVAQPITMLVAVQVLHETGTLRGSRGTEICSWLAEVADADGAIPAVLPSLAPYPHAPWMQVTDPPAAGLIATGRIAGLLLGAGVEHPWLVAAAEYCRHAVEQVEQTHPYEVEAAVAFLDATSDRAWAGQQAKRLGALVREQRIVLLDSEHPEEARLCPGYAPGEFHLPYDYAPRPDSVARDWFSDEEMARSLRHLAAQQHQDGGWPVSWLQWSPVNHAESRPRVTIDALLTLRAYDQALDRG